MQIIGCDLKELKDYSNKEVCKSMLKFWSWQLYNSSVSNRAAASAPDSLRRANKRAIEEYDRNYNDMGFGRIEPHSEKEIKNAELRAETVNKQYLEMKAYYDYFLNFVCEDK
jgi:hypothetical protein